jgi:hypothetical protein
VANTLYNVDIALRYSGTNGSLTVENNIFGKLYSYDAGKYINIDYSVYNRNANINHNLFEEPLKSNAGCDQCLQAVPLFADCASNDFHLQAGSPAIDSGVESEVYQRFYDLYGIDISVDITGAPRIQGRSPDIGAYEHVEGALPVVGDVNGDSVVNSLDVQACVNHILGTQDWAGKADVNKDSAINALDIQAVVNIILGV